jgi:integrase
MRVFKTTYRDRKGKQQEAAKWYVEFRDHLERVKRLPAFTDKAQSEAFGRKIERLVDCRANNEPTDPELSRWVETLPQATREAMARIGLLEASRAAAVKRLSEHLNDFEAAILARGKTAKHAELVTKRARTLFDGCGFKLWSDVQAAKVEANLATLRESTDEETGISAQTSNFYLAAAKQFGKWMVREERATRSPLEHLRGLNVATDRRHERRALSADELRRLVAAAQNGPEVLGMRGAERALLYRLAVETGLRSNELRSLVRTSFRFGKQSATVVVEARNSKRRRQDELPIRAETAELIQTHVATKHPGAAVFAMPRADGMADMLRSDLLAARTAWLDEAGTPEDRAERERSTFLADRDEAGQVVDFHGLRHTFITLLARSGVHPSVMQAMARHSDPKLTLARYTHVETAEQAEALALLPSLTTPPRGRQRATGTTGDTRTPAALLGHEDNQRPSSDADSVLAVCLAFPDSFACASVQSGAVELSAAGANAAGLAPRQNAGFAALTAAGSEVPPIGIEPTTYGLGNRPADSTNTNSLTTYDDAENVLAFCLAFLDRESPDLAAVVRSWSTLSEAMRAGILTMVRASGSTV